MCALIISVRVYVGTISKISTYIGTIHSILISKENEVIFMYYAKS